MDIIAMHIVSKDAKIKFIKEKIREELEKYNICHVILETEEEICDNVVCNIKLENQEQHYH